LAIHRPAAGSDVRPHHHAVRARPDHHGQRIAHIVANSYNGIGIVKIFFQPNVDIRTANAQVTAISQTLLKQLPPGATPPLILNYNASTVPIIQLALSGEGLTEQNLADIGINQLRTPLVTFPARRSPIPMAANSGRSRSTQSDRASGAWPVRPGRRQHAGCAKPDHAGRRNKNRLVRIYRAAQQLAAEDRRAWRSPIKAANGAWSMCDVATIRDGNSPQTNIVHVNGYRSVLMMVRRRARSRRSISSPASRRRSRSTDPVAGCVENRLCRRSVDRRGAIAAVAREGIIVALLTSVMILLFLGSWRSTIIIATSIPLAVLGSIILLSIGETLNTATPDSRSPSAFSSMKRPSRSRTSTTISSKASRSSTRSGRRQPIVVPAFVSLLASASCLCRCFQGVARFLFVPMAEADVRDGVVVHPVAHAGADHGEIPAAPA
jgi:hypothetical protein